MKKNLMYAVITICMSCLLLTGCGGNTLDMKDYVTVEFSGLDTVGEAKLRLDEDALLVDALGEPPSTWSGSMQYMQDAMIVMASISYQMEPEEGLSNGDKVTVNFTFDNETLKEKEIKLKGDKLTFTVEGLEKGTEIDPFEDIEVHFEGISPDAKLVVKNKSTDEFLQTISYKAVNEEGESAKEGGLCLGETVVLEANYNKERAAEARYVLKETQKEYVVEGVPRYAESLDELQNDMQDFLDDSKICADENWEHYGSAMKRALGYDSEFDRMPYSLGDSHYTIYKQSEPKMVGIYFMKAKDNTNAKNTRLGIVYETIVNDSNINQDLSIYNVVEYNELYWDSNDELFAHRISYSGSKVSDSYVGKDGLQQLFENAAVNYEVEQTIFQ